MTAITKPKRVLGVVRVSEVGDRQPDNLHSPDVQAERIREACKADEFKLVGIYEEIDVSGKLPLAKRTKLRAAIEAVEAGEADVIMVSYFDRLVRAIKVQAEVVERVEAAGGEVLTLDIGKLTNGTAVQRLTANFLGSVAQFFAEQTAEKSAEGQARAVAAGKFIGPTPIGYRVGADGVLVVDEATAEIVREAFARRDAGATCEQIKDFLAEHQIKRHVSGVRKMLAARSYLGEVHFGDLHNLKAHEPIVDRDVFRRVQKMIVSAGRRTQSERLLARLGVLRCGTCGGRMSASVMRGTYPFYRCASQACGKCMTIGATIVEEFVWAKVLEARADAEGRASAGDHYANAVRGLEQASAKLDRLIRALADFDDERASVEVLAAAREERDQWQAEVDHLRPATIGITVKLDDPDLSLEAKRGVIRATIDTVTVSPGRGTDRIAIKLLGE